MRGGGAERVALTLIRDFVGRGHAVDVLLMQAEGELMGLLPAEVRVVDLHARRIRDVFLPLLSYFRKEQPAGIQISMWPLTVVGILAHRASGSRSRLVVSDHITLSKQYGYYGRARHRLLKASLRVTYPWADARIIVSKQAADDLSRLSGLDRKTIEVIYNPIEAPPRNHKTTPEIEVLWGSSSPRIITVGSFKEQKNHALLIRSFARLLRQRPAKLMLLGEGSLRPRLTQLAAAEGVADHVLMPGFFRNPWPFYDSADLFVLSSDYEGFGNVLVEAMRAGLDVVSTDCESGPREILDNGRYGELVPCNDADALSRAMGYALDRPTNPDILRARAEEIAGQSRSDRYLELMTSKPLPA
jgi:glycosyltransferase involved in cell wall biosynthesis